HPLEVSIYDPYLSINGVIISDFKQIPADRRHRKVTDDSSLFIGNLAIANDESRPVLADSTSDHLGALRVGKRRVETMDDRRRYMREDRLLREFTGMCANQDLERLGSVADVAEAQRVGRLRRPVDVMKRTVHVVLA